MGASLILHILLFCCLCASAAAAKPHIIMMLVDDLGFGNVGFNNDEVPLALLI